VVNNVDKLQPQLTEMKLCKNCRLPCFNLRSHYRAYRFGYVL